MAHDEFPPLTRSSQAVLKAATAMEYGELDSPRRVTAAVIREAVIQAAPFSVPGGIKEIVKVADLLDIADNLHSLPPPPPTREELNKALANVLNVFNYVENGSWVAKQVAVLRAGIAHYCKDQP